MSHFKHNRHRHGLAPAWLLLPMLAAPAAIGQDFSGEWTITPTASYNCVLGAFSVNRIVIEDNYPDVTVSLLPNFPSGPLSGTFTQPGSFVASLVVPGSCRKVYTLSVNFTGPVAFTGTFRATYTGYYGCANCTTQNLAITGTIPSVSTYGSPTNGCAGPPGISTNSPPQIGNQNFAVTGDNAPSSAAGVIVFTDAPLDPPMLLFDILVWVDPLSQFLVGLPAQSDAQGSTTQPVPIPGDPSLIGFELFAQLVWSDACGVGGFSASQGLAMTVH